MCKHAAYHAEVEVNRIGDGPRRFGLYFKKGQQVKVIPLSGIALPKELSKDERKNFYYSLRAFCQKIQNRSAKMDTKNGHLRMLEEMEKEALMAKDPDRRDIFSVGEEVTIRESKFRITKITEKKITLRILPRA